MRSSKWINSATRHRCHEVMNEFLELFDTYAAARVTLRELPDDSPETSAWIEHCASLWSRVCEARAALDSQTAKAA